MVFAMLLISSTPSICLVEAIHVPFPMACGGMFGEELPLRTCAFRGVYAHLVLQVPFCMLEIYLWHCFCRYHCGGRGGVLPNSGAPQWAQQWCPSVGGT